MLLAPELLLTPELRGILRARAEGPPAPAAAPRALGTVLCVEVLRACGLAAGVREAAAWLGGGARPARASHQSCARTARAGSALAAHARATDRHWSNMRCSCAPVT